MKKVLLLIMLLCLCGCSSVKPITTDEQLKIFVTSDIHYFLEDYYKDCSWFEESMLMGDGKMVTYGGEIVDAFVKRVIEEKPHLVIITGDLSFYGEIGSHTGLANKLKPIKDAGIEVAVIPGNHDVDSLFSKGYGSEDYFDVESVDAKRFREIYKDLGYQFKQHKDSLSYRVDLNNDYSLLMVDSTAHVLTGAGLDVGGYFTDETYAWVEKQLKDITSHNKIPLVSFHHSLLVHNEFLGGSYVIKDRENIKQLLLKYNVPFVLTGHVHHQNIKEEDGIYDIASSSLVDAPLQYGIIELNKEEINYKTDHVDISVNDNDYFDLVTKTKFGDSMNVIEDEKVRNAMMEVIIKANRYYFTGNILEHVDELKNMEGYKYYLQEEGDKVSFYKEYLDSMINDASQHQSLHIDL